jgi:hypothetical protein
MPMLKKTETIELRLPYATKQAFMASCRTAGVSASEALRGYIADYVAKADRKRPKRAALAARIGLAVGALAAVGVAAEPALARAAVSASFAQMDANRDGRVSWSEFSRAARPQITLDVGAGPAKSEAVSEDLKDRILHESFTQMDRDRDGWISLQEYRAFAGR